MRVLVVEDNEVVADAIADGLRDQGMAVDVAYDGATGLENADLAPYDVVVLDRDLPVVHGDDVCTQLASGPSASRILMLTAAGAVANRVESLYLGADDYLGKPFDLPELAARVRALARRSPSTPPVLRRHDVELDRARRLVRRGGRLVPLTRREIGVLEVLLAGDGRARRAGWERYRLRTRAVDCRVRRVGAWRQPRAARAGQRRPGSGRAAARCR